jgi:CrcB protein
VRGGVLAAVAVGGAVGSVTRYGVAVAMPHRADTLDWATVVVNVVGCLLIGGLMVAVTEVWTTHRLVRPFLGIGVLGGFTTFSTAAVDTVTLGRHGHRLLAAGYFGGTVLAALAAVLLGVAGTRMITMRRWRR